MGKTKKVAHFGAIIILNFIFKGVIEWVLIPLFMIDFGFLKTLIFTIFFLIFLGFFSIKLYDFYKVDCLLIESLKESQQNKTNLKKKSKLIDLILGWTDKNKFLLGFFLSSQNPALLVLYYRDGHNLYNGFTGKNLKLIFIRNILISSIYLNILLWLGTRALK